MIVAACVMTFEARDSAAKIVPARFRKTIIEKPHSYEPETGMRNNYAQTKWLNSPTCYKDGHFFVDDGLEFNRKAMTTAFIKFSKTIHTSEDSQSEYYTPKDGQQLIKCPSAPHLAKESPPKGRGQCEIEAPRILKVYASRPQVRRLSTNVLPRQTMSVDNPALREVYTPALPSFVGGSKQQNEDEMALGASATAVHQHDADSNLALDLHLPQYPLTLMVHDNSRSPSIRTSIIDEVNSDISIKSPRGSVSEAGRRCRKISLQVDKQTSTNECDTSSLNYSNILSPTQKRFGNASSSGGSFRDQKRTKLNKRVKRSETIDTASYQHRRRHHHTPQSSQQHHR